MATSQMEPTSQKAIESDAGRPVIVRPFDSGAIGPVVAQAPTDASRPVGVISLAAGIGGLHPHQRYLDATPII
jgi:hypothetical protein